MINFTRDVASPSPTGSTPPLTTIRYSWYDMARNAAEMLTRQITGAGSGPQHAHPLSTEVVTRGSIASPSRPAPADDAVPEGGIR